jgi:hypothetical protein
MGLFGGSEEDVLPFVRELVEAAEGDTVTSDALTDSTLNDPVVDHLHDREQPHHVLTARNGVLRVDEPSSTRTVRPADGYRAVTVLTDRRMLFLVGRDVGDDIRVVDYGDVHEFQVNAGLLKTRLEVTLHDVRYTTYVMRSVDAAQVREYLERTTGKPARTGTDGRAGTDPENGSQTPLAPEAVEEALRSIDEYEFERIVAALWRRRGWQATVTRGAADRGVDVVATKDHPFPRKQVIQGKRYAADNPVGSPAIREYASLDRQEAGVDSVVVVTTSRFTDEAERTARDLNVKLVDGASISGLIADGDHYDLVTEFGDPPDPSRASDDPAESVRGDPDADGIPGEPSATIEDTLESSTDGGATEGAPDSPGDQSQGGNPPDDHQPNDQQPDNCQSDDQLPGDQSPDDQLPGDQSPDDQPPGDQSPDDQRPDDSAAGDGRVTDQRPGDQGPGESHQAREMDDEADGASPPAEMAAEGSERLCVEDEPVIRADGDERNKYGSARGHATVGLLTTWWTLGIGNLAYAAWAHHHYTYPEADEESVELDAPPSHRWYYGILAGFGVVLAAGALGATGFESIAGAGLLVAVVLLPVATYFDVRLVRAETEWNPVTGWWVLGALILPLSPVVVPVYLIKRSLANGTLGLDGEEVPPDAE